MEDQADPSDNHKEEKKKEKKSKKDTKKKKPKKDETDEDPMFRKLKEGLVHLWATRYREADECFEPYKDEDAVAAGLYAQCTWIQVSCYYLHCLFPDFTLLSISTTISQHRLCYRR